jgi:hypothetical protein
LSWYFLAQTRLFSSSLRQEEPSEFLGQQSSPRCVVFGKIAGEKSLSRHRLLLMNKLLGVCLCCVTVACCATAFALPPLGLTPTNLATGGALEIIDGTAYISSTAEVRTVSSTGELGLIGLSHPLLSSPHGITGVVKASDGKLYAAANFGASSFPTHAALFALNQPHSPVTTWDSALVVGVDANLRTYGNVEGSCLNCYAATYFKLDGSSQEMPFPAGTDNTNTPHL